MDGAESGAVPYLRSAADREMTIAMRDPRRQKNLRTALILASVALMFALGYIGKQIWLG